MKRQRGHRDGPLVVIDEAVSMDAADWDHLSVLLRELNDGKPRDTRFDYLPGFAGAEEPLDIGVRCGCCRGHEGRKRVLAGGAELCDYCYENCVLYERCGKLRP